MVAPMEQWASQTFQDKNVDLWVVMHSDHSEKYSDIMEKSIKHLLWLLSLSFPFLYGVIALLNFSDYFENFNINQYSKHILYSILQFINIESEQEHQLMYVLLINKYNLLWFSEVVTLSISKSRDSSLAEKILYQQHATICRVAKTSVRLTALTYLTVSIRVAKQMR